jgi:hypothetical protein
MIRKKLVNPAGVPKNRIQIGKQRKRRTHTWPTLQVSQKEKKEERRKKKEDRNVLTLQVSQEKRRVKHTIRRPA